MVLEHAVITIRPGTTTEFETALAEARSVVSGSKGFVSLQAYRGIEAPDRYLLLIEWETIEDHVEGFRQSEAFTRWRSLIGPYFESPPVVEHLAAVEGLAAAGGLAGTEGLAGLVGLADAGSQANAGSLVDAEEKS